MDVVGMRKYPTIHVYAEIYTSPELSTNFNISRLLDLMPAIRMYISYYVVKLGS